MIANKVGRRPYYYSFKINDNRVCIPLRSNWKTVPNKYKIQLGHEPLDKPNYALDLTKLIVISNQNYLQYKIKVHIP